MYVPNVEYFLFPLLCLLFVLRLRGVSSSSMKSTAADPVVALDPVRAQVVSVSLGLLL